MFRTSTLKMSTESTARAFFTAPHFAVVGASSDPSKFGHKSTSLFPLFPSPPFLTNKQTVFNWYNAHSLPVTPINPSSPTITAPPSSTSYTTLPSLSALPNPKSTSVSIITPPKITRKVLEEAKGLGIKSVWLQPGTFDDEVLGYARKEFENAVGGEGGVGSEGWCVLVDGGRALEGGERL
jgi:predicted CoA-binding protein